MDKRKSRQAIITIDLETRRVKVTDENGRPARKLGQKAAKALYKEGVTYVALVSHDPDDGEPGAAKKAVRKAKQKKPCVVVNVGGSTLRICE
jgi:hypothetical protein